jgi:GMP synthase-like glutamine amidotransferase
VVVWEADGSVDGRCGYGRAIAERLVAAGLGVATVPLTRRPPTELEAHAPAHVVSGGATSVHDDPRWLVAARAALRPVLERALDGHGSVTGICFGSQLIASLLAGPRAVDPHPAGMQAGLVDAWGSDGGPSRVVSSLHFHWIRRDAIETAGARVVLESTHTEVQAFTMGDGVRGVQFHPELDPRSLAAALRTHRPVLRAQGACGSRAAATIRARRREWTDELWTRFVGRPAIAASPAPTHRDVPPGGHRSS